MSQQNETKEPVMLTEIEMIAKDVIADLLMDSNTKAEWMDGDDDRNGEHILYMSMPKWKIMDIIDTQLKKRIINQTHDSKEKENNSDESGS